jgi:hypothetical protein
VNNIFIGRSMNFSMSDPNLLFFGSQDYNGAVTTNGGATWTYTSISGEAWGGFCYGEYALNKDVFVVGDSPGWSGARRIKVSRDGVETWQNLTRQTPLRGNEKDGGREAVMVRVHPRTRELWVATSCYGFWAWTQDGA